VLIVEPFGAGGGPDIIARVVGPKLSELWGQPVNIENHPGGALGATTKKRSSLVPDVPTIAEAGVPGFDYPIWYGVWVPAGTPAHVVDKLAKDIARAFATPDLRDWLVKHGGDPMSMTQPEFARFVVSESENAARIANAAEIKPQ
jgi:tripartite-type tricarboxylate transporter receptor subunit TctC